MEKGGRERGRYGRVRWKEGDSERGKLFCAYTCRHGCIHVKWYSLFESVDSHACQSRSDEKIVRETY